MKKDLMSKMFWGHCLMIMAAAILMTSCGEKKPQGLPELHPCKIKVVQEGAPLAGVILYLKGASTKYPLSGTTDQEGIAEIVTMGKYSGAPEGEYTVTLEKRISDPEKIEPKVEAGVLVYPNAKLYSLLDPKLSDEKKSPHKITVEKKSNSFDIDVGKKVKIFLGNTGDPH